jgi:hypothetical protein
VPPILAERGLAARITTPATTAIHAIRARLADVTASDQPGVCRAVLSQPGVMKSAATEVERRERVVTIGGVE